MPTSPIASDLTHRTYESADIVALYGRPEPLQKPEKTLLAQLEHRIGNMAMLDIGVGGGRTSRYFAPLAKSYLGIDYSRAMIEQCRGALPQFEFRVGDVRNLDFAGDGTYDFVLFSYNGIDHLDSEQRKLALGEMQRVLRPGGFMAFSSHNTNFLPEIVRRFRFRIHANPRETLRSLKWSMIFWAKNRLLQYRLPLAVGRVHDGTHSFKSSALYYVRPDVGADELRRLGMVDISCAGNESDEFIPADDPRVPACQHPWIYYVARKPGPL